MADSTVFVARDGALTHIIDTRKIRSQTVLVYETLTAGDAETVGAATLMIQAAAFTGGAAIEFSRLATDTGGVIGSTSSGCNRAYAVKTRAAGRAVCPGVTASVWDAVFGVRAESAFITILIIQTFTEREAKL